MLNKTPILIKKKEDIFYLTGQKFLSGYLLLKPKGDMVYYGDGLEMAKNLKTATYKDLKKVISKTSNLFVDKTITLSESDWLKKDNPKLKVEILSDPLMEDRIIKDKIELKKLKKAYQITVEVFAEIRKFITSEVRTEVEVANQIRIEGLRRGVLPSFDPIVASGVNSSIPHHSPTSRKLKKSESITLDFGFFYEGYASDFTRTIFLKKLSAKQEVAYNAVKVAYEKSVNAARPAMLGKELDMVAREYLETLGLGKYFIHSLGHGTGLEIHESPSVGPGGEDELDNGMVFSIEPGVYYPKDFGIRIEDLFYLDNKAKYFAFAEYDLESNIL